MTRQGKSRCFGLLVATAVFVGPAALAAENSSQQQMQMQMQQQMMQQMQHCASQMQQNGMHGSGMTNGHMMNRDQMRAQMMAQMNQCMQATDNQPATDEKKPDQGDKSGK